MDRIKTFQKFSQSFWGTVGRTLPSLSRGLSEKRGNDISRQFRLHKIAFKHLLLPEITIRIRCNIAHRIVFLLLCLDEMLCGGRQSGVSGLISQRKACLLKEPEWRKMLYAFHLETWSCEPFELSELTMSSVTEIAWESELCWILEVGSLRAVANRDEKMHQGASK